MNKIKRGGLLKFSLFLFLAAVLMVDLVSASVGIGISPSKMKEQLVAGKTYTYNILVFNTGSSELEISLSALGELKGFTQIEPESLVIQPEPQPQELPIKNGQYFKVTFTPPRSGKMSTYVGTLSAIGKTSSDSQFGGNVGVSSQVELVVLPPKSIFSRLNTTHYIIIGAIVLVILLIFLFKRLGIKISVGTNNTSKQKSKKKNRK